MVSNVHSKTTDDNRYTATSWSPPSSIIGDVYSNTAPHFHPYIPGDIQILNTSGAS